MDCGNCGHGNTCCREGLGGDAACVNLAGGVVSQLNELQELCADPATASEAFDSLTQLILCGPHSRVAALAASKSAPLFKIISAALCVPQSCTAAARCLEALFLHAPFPPRGSPHSSLLPPIAACFLQTQGAASLQASRLLSPLPPVAP